MSNLRTGGAALQQALTGGSCISPVSSAFRLRGRWTIQMLSSMSTAMPPTSPISQSSGRIGQEGSGIGIPPTSMSPSPPPAVSPPAWQPVSSSNAAHAAKAARVFDFVFPSILKASGRTPSRAVPNAGGGRRLKRRSVRDARVPPPRCGRAAPAGLRRHRQDRVFRPAPPAVSRRSSLPAFRFSGPRQVFRVPDVRDPRTSGEPGANAAPATFIPRSGLRSPRRGRRGAGGGCRRSRGSGAPGS